MTDEVRDSENTLYREVYAKTLHLLEEQGLISSEWRRAVLADGFAKQVCAEVFATEEAAKVWSEKVVKGGWPTGNVMGMAGQGFKCGEVVDLRRPTKPTAAVLLACPSEHPLSDIEMSFDQIKARLAKQGLVNGSSPGASKTGDIHTQTTAEFLTCLSQKSPKEQRAAAMNVNFIARYGYGCAPQPLDSPATEPTKDK